MVIDADAHANEPKDLFDRYLEKEFRANGPKVVEIDKVHYWMVEGKLFPRPVGNWAWNPQRLRPKGRPDMAITPLDSTTSTDASRTWIKRESIFRSSTRTSRSRCLSR